MDKTTEERAHACYIVHRGACRGLERRKQSALYKVYGRNYVEIFFHPNRIEMAYRLKGDNNNEKSYYNN